MISFQAKETPHNYPGMVVVLGRDEKNALVIFIVLFRVEI